jgi:C-methyltransferase C-terminal domain/Putative zinc binding domain/Methyltransferase domain
MTVCRFCNASLQTVVVDLGMSPLCETFLTADQLNHMEPFYPLRVYACNECWLVQLEEYVSPEHIFSFYPYFSSFSDSWLRHAERYVTKAVTRFDLSSDNLVVELGSNDGYLLQFFVAAGIPVLGIEPAKNVAEEAAKKGIPTRAMFFGREPARQLVKEGLRADLIVGNNVLAQVPDLNSFVAGIKILLADEGAVTIEFPHLMRLVEQNQFDTIYHEHFSYFSLSVAGRIASAHGLDVFDVEELPSHGGSLRVYFQHAEGPRSIEPEVKDLLELEEAAGLNGPDYYAAFSDSVQSVKRQLLGFLIDAKREGKTIAGYGAPGKGNTLLNYCGIRTDFLDFTVDRNSLKQGRFLPGTHIPIMPPEAIDEARPDYVLILPWNLKNEIAEQLKGIRSWGGRFVVPIPQLEVW